MVQEVMLRVFGFGQELNVTPVGDLPCGALSPCCEPQVRYHGDMLVIGNENPRVRELRCYTQGGSISLLSECDRPEHVSISHAMLMLDQPLCRLGVVYHICRDPLDLRD